jgi:hypothetical protein
MKKLLLATAFVLAGCVMAHAGVCTGIKDPKLTADCRAHAIELQKFEKNAPRYPGARKPIRNAFTARLVMNSSTRWTITGTGEHPTSTALSSDTTPIPWAFAAMPRTSASA